MLTKLTKKQLALLPQKVKKWVDIATTGTTNERKAKKALIKTYKLGGLRPPKVIIFLDNPIKCMIGRYYAAAYLNVLTGKRDQVGDQVYDQVYAQVRAQVDAQVRAQVDAQVDAQVRDQVYDQVYDQVRDQVDAQVYAQVRAQVDAQVRAQVDAQVRAQVDAQVYAQVDDQVRAQVGDQVHAQVGDQAKNLWQWYTFSIWWCAWLAYQETLCEFAKLDFKTEGIRDLFEARASWTWCYPDIAIICRMPKIYRNERGQLHRENGPAVEYPDGYGLWLYNGVAVTEKIIMKSDTLTKEDIINEQNEEVRRVIIEKIGPEKFSKMMAFTVVSEDDFGALITTKVGDDEYMYAHVLCPSTNREYYLQVPATLEEALRAMEGGTGLSWEEWNESKERSLWPKSGRMESCKQACGWTFGKSEQEYNPLIQT